MSETFHSSFCSFLSLLVLLEMTQSKTLSPRQRCTRQPTADDRMVRHVRASTADTVSSESETTTVCVLFLACEIQTAVIFSMEKGKEVG